MKNERRELLLKVHKGYDANLPFLNLINDMAQCDAVLHYLVRKRITGKNFEQWIHDHAFKKDPVLHRRQFSMEHFYANLLMAIEKTTDARTLNLYKDFN